MPDSTLYLDDNRGLKEDGPVPVHLQEKTLPDFWENLCSVCVLSTFPSFSFFVDGVPLYTTHKVTTMGPRKTFESSGTVLPKCGHLTQAHECMFVENGPFP